MVRSSNSSQTNGTVGREVDAIGKEFATGYYDAFTATPSARSRRFYDHRSKYVLLRYGRGPDLVVRGADQIERFNARMRYHECTLTVKSVDAIRVGPDWLAVLAVGELTRPAHARRPPRTFVQSTVVRCASPPPPPPSSSVERFVVVGTVFMFDDKFAVDDVFVSPPEPEPACPSVDAAVTHRADIMSSTHCADVLDPLEMIEKQPIAPAKKNATKNRDSIGGGQQLGNVVTVRDALNTVQKSKTEPQPSAVKDTSKQSSENRTDRDYSKQDEGANTNLVELKMSQKHPAQKKSARLKDSSSGQSTSNQGVDEIKTNMDGAVITTDSKTKQKSIKKKKSTVAEEKPACSIGKSNSSEEQDTVRNTTKESNKKNKGSVKDNSPAFSVAAELYVGRLSKLIETDQLIETFSKFGKLISANIFEGSGKNKSELERRNYGIIQYENFETVDLVASFATVVLGNGDEVIVEKSKKKSKPQAKPD